MAAFSPTIFRRIWDSFEKLKDLLDQLTEYVDGHQELVKQLLKKPPGKP